MKWVDQLPLNLRPKWLLYVGEPKWLKIEPWIEQANCLVAAEARAKNSLDGPDFRLPHTDFGIRQYRIVDPDYLRSLLRTVRASLEAVVSTPRPDGIEHIEPDPLVLFLFALGNAEPSAIRRCLACSKYFYARRKDQIACSKSCTDVERQRRFRERHPAYEKTRKLSRKRKAERKLGKKVEILRRLKSN